MEPGQSHPSPSTKWWTRETTAVVTGANRGIGYAVAKKLAESGVRVILTARDPTKGLQAIQQLISSTTHPHLVGLLHFAPLDVSDPSSISSFSAWFKSHFGVLDILVNNAGVSFNDVHENSVKNAETVMRTNFEGPALLIESLLPYFRCSPSKSRILNITSRLGLVQNVRNPRVREILEDEENLTEEKVKEIANLFLDHVKQGVWKTEGWPSVWTDYAVSKLALNAYSRVLAKRLSGRSISVHCFCPGFTQTGMTGGKGSRSPDTAASLAASLALLQPEQLQSGKFTMGSSLALYSKF